MHYQLLECYTVQSILYAAIISQLRYFYYDASFLCWKADLNVQLKPSLGGKYLCRGYEGY